jgi:voltage-gated sodium channel type XI alpha
VKDNPILNYNIGGWQNIGSSFILVFQIITQDNWSMNMYAMISATEFFLPVLFAFVINMVGSYFLMNLMLAVIMDEYVESE